MVFIGESGCAKVHVGYVAYYCESTWDFVDSAKIVQPVPQAVHSKKPVVLAVDADPALRASLKCYLQNEGYEVIAASSSDEALEVLKLHTPALVIAEVEGEGFPAIISAGT